MTAKIVDIRTLFLCLGALFTVELGARVVFVVRYSRLPVLGTTRLVEILLLLLIVSIWGKGMSSIGLARDQISAGLRKGLMWSAAFGLCTLLGCAVLYAAHVNPLLLIRTDVPPGVAGRGLLFVVGGLVAPVAEEIFFRGVVYGFLRRWGVLVALCGSTILFVLAHSIGSKVPLTQIVGGVVFALAYEAEGKLMVPITIHVLGNTAIFAISLVC